MRKAEKILYLCDRASGMELVYCGNSSISYPVHNHVSVFTIGVVLSGCVSMAAGGTPFVCGKDSLFVFPPYLPHLIAAEGPYSLLTVCIHKDTVYKCGRNEARSNIRRLLADAGGLGLTETQARRLFHCLDSLYGIPTPCRAETLVEAAREEIERYPQRKLGIEEMAGALYMSKYHFIRRFKEAVGLTPHQFQIQNRVRKAQRLLHDSGNMAEVALAAGFCDQSHFIKQFEKYVGLTPAAYKMSSRALTEQCPVNPEQA